MKLILGLILFSSVGLNAFAAANKDQWTITIFKSSLKSNCSLVAAIEMSLNEQMIVTDIPIQGHNAHMLPAHNITIIEKALKFEGIDQTYDEILENAVIINECEN